MDGLFNNREIAVGLWLAVFLIFAYKTAGRKSFADVLKSAFVPKILIPLVLSFIPTALVVAALAHFELWDLSLLKETIYWTIGTGFVMFGGFNKATGIKELYKHTAKETLKVVILLEFLIWFYVFALWFELLLVPFTTFIVLLVTVAKYQKADNIELTRKVLNGLQVFIGLVIIFFTTKALLNDPKSLLTFQNLELFLLPIVLSFTYTISVYFVALYSKYELVFNRIRFGLEHIKDKRAIKLAVIRRCGLSVSVTGEMIRHLAINLNNKTTKAKALKLIRTFDPKQKSFL